MRHKVLLVDDEPNVTEALQRALYDEPYEILTAGSAQEALMVMAREPIDVIVADEKMPGMRGSELLAHVRQHYPGTIRLILTGHAELEAAIRAINDGGVHRFLTKPCSDVDLASILRDAVEQKHLMDQSHRLLDQLSTGAKWLKAHLGTLQDADRGAQE